MNENKPGNTHHLESKAVLNLVSFKKEQLFGCFVDSFEQVAVF